MKHDIDDLILLNIAGIGYIRLGALLERFRSTKKILNAGIGELSAVKDIGPVMSQRIYSLREKGALKKERSLIKEHKACVLSVFDDDYPSRLKNIYDPPLILYIKSALTRDDEIAVALVGSRRASSYGLDICGRLSGGLARFGVTVVSGLARGIDSAAHRGALAAGGRTLAVLGNGLGAAVYPPENKKLAEEICRSGALISEFPMEAPPLPRNFPIRNRVISGLSLGVVIVEAARKSGALITAECALSQGREVFAVPGRADTGTCAGTHGLIKNGARLVDGIKDILEELNLEPAPFKKGAPAGPEEGGRQGARSAAGPKGLGKDERRIYDMLSGAPEHIDSIIERSDLAPGEVMKLLLEMEIKKFVKQLPGKNFIAA